MTASLSGVLSAERPHLRNLSDDATGERADRNPPTQFIGNASPLGISPDENGPEGTHPPGYLSALDCSKSGNGALFLVPPHAPMKQRSA